MQVYIWSNSYKHPSYLNRCLNRLLINSHEYLGVYFVCCFHRLCYFFWHHLGFLYRWRRLRSQQRDFSLGQQCNQRHCYLLQVFCNGHGHLGGHVFLSLVHLRLHRHEY